MSYLVASSDYNFVQENCFEIRLAVILRVIIGSDFFRLMNQEKYLRITHLDEVEEV